MRDHTWAGQALRAILVVVLVVPLIGYFAPAASAHHPILSVDAGCSAESGEWEITWTVANGNWSGRVMTVDQVTYSDSLLTDIKHGLVLGPNATESDTVSYSLSDSGVKTLTVKADWSDGGPQHVSRSLSIDLSQLDDTGCQRPPTDASVTVSAGSCSWNGESSEAPVKVVIAPTSGAMVTITGPGGSYVATGSGDAFTLDPGSYTWVASAAPGFSLVGRTSGRFTVGECPPLLGSIGDFVWYDGVEPDEDGIQGSGESGIAGVIVNLYDGTGTTKLDTTVTDAGGNYLFTDLAAGTYVVEFVIPDGLGGVPGFGGFTIVGKGTVSTGSDADRTTGRTGVITLAAGQNDLTWDAGVVRASVSPTTVTRPATTVTTSPTTETLPFTGASGTTAGGIGAALLLLGGLVTLAFRKKEEPVVEAGAARRLD
ncbi:MAG: hypothetical protein GXP34_00895 [Actinobacteria bacterium]|nr:hypothetical protein [Actinomycetota bacterium]